MHREALIEHIIAVMLEAAPRINLNDPRTQQLQRFDDPKRVQNVFRHVDPTVSYSDSLKKAAQYIPSTAKYLDHGIEAATFVNQPNSNPASKEVYRISASPKRRGVFKRPDIATQAKAVRTGKTQVEKLPWRDMGDRSSPKRGHTFTGLLYNAVAKGKLPVDLHRGNIGVDPTTKKAELVDPGFVRRLTPSGKKIAREYLLQTDPSKMTTGAFERGLRDKLNKYPATEGPGYKPSPQDKADTPRLHHWAFVNESRTEKKGREAVIEAILEMYSSERISPSYFHVESIGTINPDNKLAFMVTDNFNIYVGPSGHPTMLRGRQKQDMMGGGWLDLVSGRIWFVSGSLGRFPRPYQEAVQGALENFFRKDFRVMR
jgi:hypothetical protein